MLINKIILAINLSTSLPSQTVELYAKQIQKSCEVKGVEPLEIIAIITHESQWNAGIISPNGFDYGLMQIRKKYYKGNANNLLDPLLNINIGVYYAYINKEFCFKLLKRDASFQEWLSGYTGTWGCKPTELTKMFDEYKICIQKDIENDTNSNCRKIYWKDFRP